MKLAPVEVMRSGLLRRCSCGGEAVIVKEVLNGITHSACAKCEKCGMRTDYMNDIFHAFDAWQNDASLPEQMWRNVASTAACGNDH